MSWYTNRQLEFARELYNGAPSRVVEITASRSGTETTWRCRGGSEFDSAKDALGHAETLAAT